MFYGTTPCTPQGLLKCRCRPKENCLDLHLIATYQVSHDTSENLPAFNSVTDVHDFSRNFMESTPTTELLDSSVQTTQSSSPCLQGWRKHSCVLTKGSECAPQAHLQGLTALARDTMTKQQAVIWCTVSHNVFLFAKKSFFPFSNNKTWIVFQISNHLHLANHRKTPKRFKYIPNKQKDSWSTEQRGLKIQTNRLQPRTLYNQSINE